VSSPHSDFDLLLEAPTSVEADMAREILSQAGIPTYLHGRDRDLAELGAAIHCNLTRPDLFVPKGRRAKAEAILKEAWDESALTDEVALSVPLEDEPILPRAPSGRAWTWMVAAVLLVVFVLLYYQNFKLQRQTEVPWRSQW
jgi:Putative prokaryotic signal transducing protein